MSIHQISSTNHINNNDRDKNEESNLKKNNKIIINDKDDNSRSSSSICSENSHCINNHLNNNNDYLCSKQFPVRNNKNNISNVNNNHDDDDDDNDDNNIVKIPNNNNNNNNNINEHYHQECNNNSNNNNNNNNNHHHHSCLNNHIKESECSISVNINSNNNQNSNNNNNNTDPMNNNKLSPEYVSLVDNEQKPNDDEEEAEMALNAKLPSINRKHVEIVNSCQIEMSQLRTKSQTIRFSFLALFKACSPRGPMVMKLFSAFFFAISSFLLVVVNKVVLTTFHFPSVLVLGLGQVVATIVILNICRRLNIVKFPYYSREINSKLFPLPFFYLGNLVSGLGSTKLLNLPMLTVLRRFTILMTMIGEFYLLGVNQTLTIKLTVLMMISGAIIAASNDLAFDAAGYLYVLLNDVFSTFNGIYMKKKLDSRDLGKYGILYYNALFIVGPMFLISICVDDWHHCFLEYEHWNSPLFILSFLTSCVMGFILMYSTALCTQHNSALTTTIVGCLKNILVTFIGMYIGGDYIFSIVNFIGLNISMIGSLIYSYVIFIHKPSPSKPSKALPTVKQ